MVPYLKLSQVNIQSTIKTERSCDGGHNLTNQSVQVGVSWPLNVQVTTADVIDGLIVHHEGTVRVFQGGVSGQNGVVRLNNSRGDLRRGVDGKFQLGFLSIVNRQTLHKQRCESRTSTSTKGMEDEKTLQTGALISLKCIQKNISRTFCRNNNLERIFPDPYLYFYFN